MAKLCEIQLPENSWLILSVAVAGIAGVGWFFAVPLGAVGLMLLAWPKYAALLPRVWRTGAERAFGVTMALSTLNALGASAAAFALGAVIRWGFL